MKELLDETKKYSETVIIENRNKDTLISIVKNQIDKYQSLEELFFYFSGHGSRKNEEFFYCTKNFKEEQTNETGISNTYLNELLRNAKANLIVKIIDACYSGLPLIKGDNESLLADKFTFKNFIQISSSLESQESFTGESISIFTEKLIDSILRKKDGIIYYRDIISILKDEYSQISHSMPYFGYQGKWDEEFINNAKCLDPIREKFIKYKESSLELVNIDQGTLPTVSLKTLLIETEKKIATPEKINSFINIFFDNLIGKISDSEFSDYFNLNKSESSMFIEENAEEYIIKILSQENRFDEFVTAKKKKEIIQRPLASLFYSPLWMSFTGNSYRDIYELELNCNMDRAQIKFEFTPKYNILKKLVLVVTCIPSLQFCYIFEIATQHKLKDFGEFNVDGDEVIRSCNKFQWYENTDNIVSNICLKLYETLENYLKNVEGLLIEK